MAIIWLSVGIAVGYFGKDKISAAYRGLGQGQDWRGCLICPVGRMTTPHR
jgi:hypothetical protein